LPLFLGQWWWEPEVGVARDGGTHRVEVEGVGEPYAIWSDQSLIDPVCTLTGDDGAPIGTTPVPRDERVFLEEPWVAVPEASSTFTAPADGVVVATCDAVDVTPVQGCTWRPCTRGSTTTRSSTGCRSSDCCSSSAASPWPSSRRSDGRRASEACR
jgi:hypothetical protein